MIYADNAATTQLDSDAFEIMKQYLIEDYANASQPYSFSRGAKKALKEARITIAECIGALPEEIYFTSGGTESDNWAIKGLMEDRDGKITLTSDIEHHAVLNACKTLSRLGYPVTYLPVDKQGVVLPETLNKVITDETKLVSIMMANNEIGTVEPIRELVEITHAHGALFHTDAVQVVGHIPINVKKLDIDMLSASGHKFNGPKGIGFLYVKKGICINPYADGGAQEKGMRAGTENVAAIVAMATALKKNCSFMLEATEKLHSMEKIFIRTLNAAKVDYIRNGGKEHIPGNISISIKGMNGEMLLHRLDLKGICISTGSACDSVNTEISHVIKAIGTPMDYAEGTIRISFGSRNTVNEAEIIAENIVDIVKKEQENTSYFQ